MTEPNLATILVYLSAEPLTGLTITLIAYSISYRLYTYMNSNSLLHPVAIAVLILISFLTVTNTSYAAYFEGGQFIHFLLGPATVALAIPLYKQLPKLRKIWLPVSIALISGAALGALSSVLIARFFGASPAIQLSLAPKSVTAPVAMGIAEKVGGIPSLTAAMVVTTGIIGAVLGTKLFALMGIKDESVKGIAMGVTAHGIGTARAFQVNSEMGAFSGLAMALSTFITALMLPWLLNLLG
jgi:predicted murein hydrolase (TIGR00659 family)